jgi:uncharacterized cupredoxin-like copper-binding protein
VAAACAALFGAALIAGALASSGRGGTPVVDVVEHDFHIALTAHRLHAGTVVFRVENDGPDAHELIIVRDAAALPLRADGITIDEEALAKREVAALEPAPAGATRDLRVRLGPGRYVLFCNMLGHFMGGMHAVVIVR